MLFVIYIKPVSVTTVMTKRPIIMSCIEHLLVPSPQPVSGAGQYWELVMG